ncbi:MAG TPA: SIR2 family protein [Leadbetterella sp.]|nr:SIR2 family protein [Leadbetterella sp.]
MKIDYLEKLNFLEILNIEELKTSRNKFVLENADETSQLSSPDLRYYWDGERFGLHTVGSGISFEELFQFLSKNYYSSKLEVLYLSDGDIINFSSKEFTTLKFLTIIDCQYLHSIELGNSKINNKVPIHSLVELRVNNCQRLWKIDFLGKYENLVLIEITNCNLTKFTTPINSTALKYINLNSNKILWIITNNSTKNLEYLYISYNLLETLILDGNFNKLNILDISNNPNLNFIYFLSSLKSLEFLDLSFTKIKLSDLKRLRDYEKLQQVLLKETIIEEKYPEDVKEGWLAVKRLLADKTVPFNHFKILMLGNTHVGKTDLVYYLKNNKQREDNNSTHGLEYHKLQFPKYKTTNPTFLHIWDFGGQEYYHGTHKLFFSGGAINLIIWSKENVIRYDEIEQCFELDYWLRCAEQLSFDSPENIKSDTIVLENKIDIPIENEGKHEFLFSPTLINQEKYAKMFGEKMNLDFSYISLKPGGLARNDPKFFDIFKSILNSKIELKKRERPVEDVDLLKKILLKRNPVIRIEEFSQVQDIETVLKVFHSMGILLYFHKEAPELIFNQPQVFLDFLYKSILKRYSSSGTLYFQLTENDIQVELNRSEFWRFLTVEQIVNLLKSFDLVFTINDDQNTYFIPQYLPKTNQLITIYRKNIETYPSVYIESDSYLMNLVIMKLFSNYGTYVVDYKDFYLFALDQLVVEKNNNIVFIEFDRPKQRLNLYESRSNKDLELIDELIKFILNLDNGNPFNNTNWISDTFQIFVTGDGCNYVSYEEANKQHSSNNWRCISTENKLVELESLNKFFYINNSEIMVNKNHKYQELVSLIKNKDAVLFLGTGISAYTTNNAPCSTWVGLLKNGIQYCFDNNISGCNQTWFETMNMLLKLNDVNQWIHVAETITQKLIEASRYKTWIKKTVGELPILKKDLIEHLGKLKLPIFTTNYDDLVKNILNKSTIHEADIDKIGEVLKFERDSIVHLHGHWDFANTLIFGTKSYLNISQNNDFQSQMKSLMMSKHLIFVGFGSGLYDPNFGPLMEWSKSLNSEHHHYKLVKNSEINSINIDPKVQNVGYGDNYDDLVPFLIEVLKDI